MKMNADVIIIGSGIVGNSAAYYLAKKGKSVIVLESDKSIGYGSSSRNGGGVRQSGRDPRELPYAIYGIKNIWPTLSEELGVDVEYYQKGNLRLALNEQHINILKGQVEKAAALGLDVTLVGADDVKRICPHLSDAIVGATWCPTDGHANPMKATLAYYARSRELGVQYYTDKKVKEIQKIKGRARKVITMNGEVYEADDIIVAAGMGSREIARSVQIDIPLRAGFGEALVTEMQPKMFDIMLGVASAEVYGHQCEHGSFVFGSGTGMEPFYDEPDGNMRNHSLPIPANCRVIMKYVPALKDAKIVRGWGGWHDGSADHVPIISKVDEVPGLTLACGFSGHGFGTGPAVGMLLSQMILGEELLCDITPLRYDRFKSNR